MPAGVVASEASLVGWQAATFTQCPHTVFALGSNPLVSPRGFKVLTKVRLGLGPILKASF